ncbi:hypothetical protein COY27_04355 [Candidatus Woesearchaeota archaeon CG_4_10_14_0_2_um_filter_33_13]|nr:MAG: hypothetical protein COY27_04355 [Candidatus Woesearchaeota archaeon CG_4_10_14_0_2_um_filter_33_13]
MTKPEMTKISGLDMRKTISWYIQNSSDLTASLDQKLQFPIGSDHIGYTIEGREHLHLTDFELFRLMRLFPDSAMQRSVLRSINGKPQLWFKKESTAFDINVTNRFQDAISPTAMVPSFVGYDKVDDQLVADVNIYRMAGIFVTPTVGKLIHAEGLLHEVAHTIIQPALSVEGYKLRLASGEIVDGFDYVMKFAEMVEGLPAISHYAATYRGPDGKFESSDERYNPILAVNEELAESIAAKLLGFTFCEETHRRKNPFVERPEAKQFVDDFLEARLYKEQR